MYLYFPIAFLSIAITSSMKHQAAELPIGKPQHRRKTPRIGPLLIFLTILCTVIPIYYPSLRYAHKLLSETSFSFAHVEDSVRPPRLLVKPSSKENNEACSDGEVATLPNCKPSQGDVVDTKSGETKAGDVKGPPKSNEYDQEEVKSLVKDVSKALTSSIKPDLTTAKALDKDSEAWPHPDRPDSIKAKALDNNSEALDKDSNVWLRPPERDRLDSTKTKALDNDSEAWSRSPVRDRPDSTTAKALDKDPKTWPRHTDRDRPTPKKPDRHERKRASHRQREEATARKESEKNRIVSQVSDNENCDIFIGEWVPNPEGPYYTNTTCWAIQEHQNCMKFGRPDTGFLKWRWKPDDCELPIFDPDQFLELVRGKSLAFVGDSVARNHMQSLLCLLSRVVYPLDVSNTTDENFKRWVYPDYNFNISIFWAPYLVRTEKTDPNDVTRPFKLYLDEFDEVWRSQMEKFDYVIISAGQWFFRPTMFYVNRQIVGCLYCPETNITHLTSYFSYRRAFRTAFRAINSLENFKGITFLRTYAPSHFEGGPWDKGGDCVRTRPFRRNETTLDDYNLKMYMIQLEELKIAQRVGRRRGFKFRLFDATKAMLLRPDGHPSKYGRWPSKNVTVPNDCVHWCLPGPIDSWNDFLQELLRRETHVRSFA